VVSASEHLRPAAPTGVSPIAPPAEPSWTRKGSRRGRIVRRRLVVADAAALLIAFVVASLVDSSFGDGVGHEVLVVVGALPAWIVGARMFGLYDRDAHHADLSTIDELPALVLFVTLGAWLGVVISWVFDLGWSTSTVVAFWATACVAVPLARAVARSLARREPAYVQNTLIVGAGDVGQLVGRKLRQHPEFGVRLVGFVDADPKRMRADLDGVPVLGTPDVIAELVRENDVQRVIVAFSNDHHSLQLDLVHALRNLDVQVDLVPRLFEAVGPVAAIRDVEGLALLTLPTMRSSWAARTTKRALDFAVSAILLVLLAPLFLWIAWRIRRDSPGPVFFRQERLGKNMRPFTVLKFRTMVVDADDEPHRAYVESIMDFRAAPTASNLYKLERPESTTKVGRWLRRTSLDELPQLINVVRGEMSLVGPRPCIAYETRMFEPHHFDRFLVPAGMTGLWQVSARANATFREALDLDAAYARNWSLGLDFHLLARTPAEVLRGGETTS
jgi:exopolysaccharide biosynthesis polyprenyl glycosylphosphotransferase